MGKWALLKHKIEVAKGTRPVRQRTYKVDPKQKEILENVVKDMLEQVIIVESDSPCEAPCLLVAKKNNIGIVLLLIFMT